MVDLTRVKENVHPADFIINYKKSIYVFWISYDMPHVWVHSWFLDMVTMPLCVNSFQSELFDPSSVF